MPLWPHSTTKHANPHATLRVGLALYRSDDALQFGDSHVVMDTHAAQQLLRLQ